MNTTNLFVELIVIGVGAFIWLILMVFSIFGFAWLPTAALLSPVMTIPILAVIYVLGIISDRIADAVFESIWSDDLLGSYYKDHKEYYHHRRIILTRSERLSDLLEYGRSRLRICRGWAFNSVMIAISLNMFLWIQLGDASFARAILIFGTIFLLLFSFAAWFAWRKLVLNEYRKIKEQAEFIVGPESEKQP